MKLSDNNILDLVISLTLIYALLSLLVSILLEWWNHYKKSRARQLKENIFQLLNDPMNFHFGELFYNHFLIAGMRSRQEKRPPQYISSKLFADVLIDIVANRDLHDQPVALQGYSHNHGKQYQVKRVPPVGVMERFKTALDRMNPSPFSDTLKSFLSRSNDDADKLRVMLASWFDDHMDRASGWYKNSQRNKLYVFGFLVAIGLNVDSLHLVKVISLDDALRNNLVQTSERLTDQYNLLSDSAKQNVQELEKMIIKVFPDSTLRKGGHLLIDPLRNKLAENIPDTVKQQIRKMVEADSLAKEYEQRADRIVNIVSSLHVPIGWDESAAPLSWFSKNPDLKKNVPSNDLRQSRLLIYMDKRNHPEAKSILLYLIGIFISGISLSFGAPFWFDALIKLVNIRRAGKKPEAFLKTP